jgi:hypothetical protein
MKSFESRHWRPAACRRELTRFRKLLGGQETLSESHDVLPLFRACKDLSLLLGELCLQDRSAEADSVFKRVGPKARRDWSPRFSHGYSQIVDWFGKLHDMQQTAEFEDRFGARAIEYSALLVAGRDRHFEPGEQRRLEWWRSFVVVNSKKIRCLTFDELLALLARRLASYAGVIGRRRRGK